MRPEIGCGCLLVAFWVWIAMTVFAFSISEEVGFFFLSMPVALLILFAISAFINKRFGGEE